MFGTAVNASTVFATTTLADKPWIDVDNTGGGTDGNLYICWTRFIDTDADGQANTSELRTARSTDGGTTWTMLATNNTTRDASSELPSFYSPSSNVDSTPTRDPRQAVQELFDTSTAWRQAHTRFSTKTRSRSRFRPSVETRHIPWRLLRARSRAWQGSL